MIRYGVNFPAWFNPVYPPTKPDRPKAPQQSYKEPYFVLIDEKYIDGSSVENFISSLSEFNSENFSVQSEKEGFISIYKKEYKEIFIEEKEFAKTLKEYEKKLRDYEKAEKEYEFRLKKYSNLLIQYEKAKYKSELKKAEDELDDIKVMIFNHEMIVYGLQKTIKECKDKLLELGNEQQDSFE